MRCYSAALALALAIGIPANALSDDPVGSGRQADEDTRQYGASRARIKAPFRLIYTTALLAHRSGADGLSLFNFGNTVVLKMESGHDLRVVYLDAGVPVSGR